MLQAETANGQCSRRRNLMAASSSPGECGVAYPGLCTPRHARTRQRSRPVRLSLLGALLPRPEGAIVGPRAVQPARPQTSQAPWTAVCV